MCWFAPANAQWVSKNNGLYGGIVYAMAVNATGIFAGTHGGVFLSVNNGTSWTAVNSGLTSTQVYSLAVSGTEVFAGTSGAGIWSRPLTDFVPSISSFSPSSGAIGATVTMTGPISIPPPPTT